MNADVINTEPDLAAVIAAEREFAEIPSKRGIGNLPARKRV